LEEPMAAGRKLTQERWVEGGDRMLEEQAA
jgi:hypothetical protein